MRRWFQVNIMTKPLYRYLESILSKEVAHLESLPKNDPNREKGEQGRQELLALTRSFQDTKELLLSYEKEVVKWAAETKLFLITKSDLIEVKSEAIEQKLPTEDFPETIDELEERTSFTHRELARWRNYFIRNGREDLAKRINPKVGDEMGTAEKGEINDLTDRIRTSATVEYAKVTDAQEKQFSDLFSGFQPTFLLPESGKSLDQARTALNEYLSKVPLYKERLTLWNPEQPYPLHRALTGFLLGKDWVTNSARQDWFGVLPLLSGSLLVSLIALALAIPFGVGSAIS